MLKASIGEINILVFLTTGLNVCLDVFMCVCSLTCVTSCWDFALLKFQCNSYWHTFPILLQFCPNSGESRWEGCSGGACEVCRLRTVICALSGCRLAWVRFSPSQNWWEGFFYILINVSLGRLSAQSHYLLDPSFDEVLSLAGVHWSQPILYYEFSSLWGIFAIPAYITGAVQMKKTTLLDELAVFTWL